MNIGLYDIDGKLPNLALMRISAYHKAKGDNVEWMLPIKIYDKVYASKIFTDSKYEEYPNMEIGGSGYEKSKKLPEEIDKCFPDYSLYPDFKDSIGFTTRGCIRKCAFCFVPEMEGGIKDYMNVKDIWRGSGNLILFDNNILAMPSKLEEVFKFCAEKKIKVDFNQGLDCRLVTPELAKLIKENRKYIIPYLRFAFDNLSYKDSVERTCKLLGIKKMFWYVYCDEDYESALERLLVLKRYSQTPYLMRNKSLKGQQKFIWLAKWVNSMGAFQKMDIWDIAELKYIKKEKPTTSDKITSDLFFTERMCNA